MNASTPLEIYQQLRLAIEDRAELRRTCRTLQVCQSLFQLTIDQYQGPLNLSTLVSSVDSASSLTLFPRMFVCHKRFCPFFILLTFHVPVFSVR